MDEITTVNPDDLSVAQIYEGKDYVTLVTCTPKYINTYRLLVRGERVPDDEVENEESKKKIEEAKDLEQAKLDVQELQKKRLIDLIVFSVGCLIIIITIVGIILKKKDKNKN